MWMWMRLRGWVSKMTTTTTSMSTFLLLTSQTMNPIPAQTGSGSSTRKVTPPDPRIEKCRRGGTLSTIITKMWYTDNKRSPWLIFPNCSSSKKDLMTIITRNSSSQLKSWNGPQVQGHWLLRLWTASTTPIVRSQSPPKHRKCAWYPKPSLSG